MGDTRETQKHIWETQTDHGKLVGDIHRRTCETHRSIWETLAVISHATKKGGCLQYLLKHSLSPEFDFANEIR
jgi:hypothetical protein